MSFWLCNLLGHDWVEGIDDEENTVGHICDRCKKVELL